MYDFAAKVAKHLDAFIGTEKLSEVLRSFKPRLEGRIFNAEQIQIVCKEMHDLSCESEYAQLDESRMCQSAAVFLLKATAEASECDMDHFKMCPMHQELLRLTFGLMLAGLTGADLKNDIKQLVLAIDVLSHIEVTVAPRGSNAEHARLANWGLLLTDPEMLKHVAHRILQLSEERQAGTLKRLAVRVGSLNERPDHNALETMIRQAVMGIGNAN